MQMVIDLFKLVFSFSGRIDRATYWRAIVIYLGVLLIVSIGALFIVGAVAALVGFALHGHRRFDLAIPFFILLIPLSARRLHDRDRSGWWLLAFFALPAVLDHLADAAATTDLQAVLFSLASSALTIWAFVELGCLRGDAGPNKFGPDPLVD